jgi:hypothetical protein
MQVVVYMIQLYNERLLQMMIIDIYTIYIIYIVLYSI